MNVPTTAQAAAFGRHVVTFAAGAVTAGAALHLLTGGQASDATTAISQISSGVASIAAGVATLVGIASAGYAALTASPLWQLLAVAKNPDVAKVVMTDPAAAGAVPSPKVTAQ